MPQRVVNKYFGFVDSSMDAFFARVVAEEFCGAV